MDRAVEIKFGSYPHDIRIPLVQIREAIFEVAARDISREVTETLKWGEPSYHVKGGSPVRMDWKKKRPHEICVYFHCQTSLINTFRQLYGHSLKFDGNRAIVLPLSEALPMKELRHCIALAFRYHSIKHLPLLGVC